MFALGAVLGWLGTTSGGAGWLLSRIEVPGTLAHEEPRGSLLRGLTLSSVRWQDEGIEVRADTVRFALAPGPGMRSVRLVAPRLEGVHVVSTRGSEATDDETTDLDGLLEALALPVAVQITDGAIVTLTYREGEADPVVLADRLDLSLRWFDSLEEINLQLLHPRLEAELKGALRLTAGETDLALEARARGAPWHEALPRDLALSAVARGDLGEIDVQLVSEDQGLRLEGRLGNVLEAPALDGTLSLERWSPPGSGDAAWVATDLDGQIRTRGTTAFLDVAGSVEAPGVEPVPWTFNGAVSTDHIEIASLTLTPGAGQLAAEGRFDFGAATETPGVPGGVPGEVPGEVLDGVLAATLNWRELQWPLDVAAPQFSSSTGRATLSGTASAWALESDFDLSATGYTEGRVAVVAEGDLDGLRFERVSGEVLGGEAELSGAIDWTERPTAEARFNLEGLDLSVLSPQWPRALEARGSLRASANSNTNGSGSDSDGDAEGAGFTIDLDLAALAGVLNDEPFSGQGELGWGGQSAYAEAFALRVGPSSLSLTGETSPEFAELKAEVDIVGTGWLGERLGGPLRGQLRLDTRAAFPVVEATLDGGPFSGPGVAVESLRLRRASERPEVRLALEGVDLGDQGLDVAELVLTAAGDGLKLDIDAVSETHRLTAQVEGALEVPGRKTGAGVPLAALAESGEANPSGDMNLAGPGPVVPIALANGFRGRLLALELADAQGALLGLKVPAPVVVDRERWEISGACMVFGAGGEACGEARWRPGLGGSYRFGLDAVALAGLAGLVSPGLAATQTLSGDFSGTWRGGRAVDGQAALTLSPGQLSVAGEADSLETGEGTLAFDFDAGALRRGRFELPIGDDGLMQTRFAIEGLSLQGDGQVTGAARLSLPELEQLTPLVTSFAPLSGSLIADVQLGGVVRDVNFDGSFDLSGASISIPRLGTAIEELSLRGRVSRSDRLVLRGRYRMGEGEGTIGVETDFSELQAPTLSVSVAGDSLDLAALPDLRIKASPDLRLRWADGAWAVAGEVAVPSARIVPESSFVNRVDESNDVVVVAGERSPAQERRRDEPVSVYGALNVRLGDDVRLEMDVASLALSGAVELAWSGLVMPTGAGEVRLAGPVTVWGPRLNIDGGRVRWDEVRIDNPAIDIRAERDVFGSSLIRTAGVRVSGTARRPDVEAYTQPLTTSDRAWALLLTGSDVDYAEGVGAFDVGTYIAPRVFLSYGISLFDSENVVGLRYDLRRGWGVKVTSGQRESGVDLSYTIEQE